MNYSLSRPYLFFGFLVFSVGLLAGGAALYLFGFPVGYSFLLGINAATFVGLGFDKGFARGGAPRVPEAIFLALALLGGTPGAIVGIHLLRHKNRKPSFQLALFLIVCVQILLWRALMVVER